MPAMRVLGLAGWSGSGKTTLVAALVGVLVARGHRVSTIKHAHHAFDIDQPGKDSHRHREAGAHEVLVASGRRWALMHELRGDAEPTLDELLGHLAPVDLVLVEGFKASAHDKIEVHRPALGQPLLAESDPRIVAIACDEISPGIAARGLPLLPLGDAVAVADFVERHCGLTARRLRSA